MLEFPAASVLAVREHFEGIGLVEESEVGFRGIIAPGFVDRDKDVLGAETVDKLEDGCGPEGEDERGIPMVCGDEDAAEVRGGGGEGCLFPIHSILFFVRRQMQTPE